jgi:hypothetical protein
VQRWTLLYCLYRDNDQSFPWGTRLQTGKRFYKAHPLITRIVVYNLYFSWSTYAWKSKKLHWRRGWEVTTQNQSKLTYHLEVNLRIPSQRPSSLLCFRHGVHELHCKPQSLLARDSQETTSSTKNSETTTNSALLILQRIKHSSLPASIIPSYSPKLCYFTPTPPCLHSNARNSKET